MTNPSNYKYTVEHLWISIASDIVTVGLTDFAQRELGVIEVIEIQNDQILETNGVFGTVESSKAVSELYMPISGKVIQVNEKVKNNPRIINNDPFGEGWLIKIQVSDMNEITRVSEYLSAEQYEEYFSK